MTVIDDAGATDAVGFWSYAHKDNDQVQGRILRLANSISDAYSLLTGDDLQMFIDRHSLSWGEWWRARIDEALQETTFFIPIVTPRYFTSQECRNELLKFSGHAQSLGATELLLPILLVGVDDLNEDSADEAKALIAKTQYQDWRELRMVDESSETYVRAVDGLARRLVQLSRDYAAKPTIIPGEIAGASQGEEVADDAPGVVDLIADMEENLPRWQQTIMALPSSMKVISDLAQEAGLQIEAGDREGKGFAHKVLVMRQLARGLEEPASESLQLSEEYAAQLVDIDPGVRALISVAAESSSPNDRENARGMVQAILGMVEASRESGRSLMTLSTSMRKAANQSRDLRPVLGKIDKGLRSVRDGQTIMDEWKRLIKESGLLDNFDQVAHALERQ